MADDITESSIPIFVDMNINGMIIPKLVNFDNVYEFIGNIAAGKFGSVNKYRHRATGVIYAIKSVALTKDIQREAYILKKLNNPGIPTYYGSFIYNKRYHIVMEYVEGITLAEYMQNSGTIDPFTLYTFTKWLFNTVNYIHSRNIVHGDIKPLNIIINTIHKRFMLVDFGFACSTNIDNPYHCKNNTSGTPYFIAPEKWIYNITDLEILKKSDIWMIGITLYALVEKKSPWKSTNIDDLKKEIISMEPPPMISGPKQIQRLITACLRKNYKQRPTASEVIQALSQVKY